MREPCEFAAGSRRVPPTRNRRAASAGSERPEDRTAALHGKRADRRSGRRTGIAFLTLVLPMDWGVDHWHAAKNLQRRVERDLGPGAGLAHLRLHFCSVNTHW